VKEEQVYIKVFFKLGRSAAKTHKMLQQAFDDDALAHKQTYDWFNQH
jgi:hypothetical protein